MEVVLIQGEENTGKTTLCKMIEDYIIQAGFNNKGRECRPNCGYEQDFTAIYEKDGCRIIINSESENNGINRLNAMYHQKNPPYNVLITAIRPPKDSNRQKSTLNGKMKAIYKNHFKGKEEIIDLTKQNADYCKYLKGILQSTGVIIFRRIKKELNCKIEIDCPILKEKNG